MGSDPRAAHAESTSSVGDFIVNRNLTDIVLVGHSYGGTVISKVVEAIPDRVRRLVFWSSPVLESGESLLDTFPPVMQEMLTHLAAASPDNTVTLPFEVWRELMMNDADDELARSTYAQLSPEPFGQLTEALDLTVFYQLATPRSYLVGTEDAVPPGEIGWHRRMASRLGAHRFVETRGGHEALFTTPVTLADSIIEAGRDG
jgi:pimeloyl-ACP methyl ester carboxylesterase